MRQLHIILTCIFLTLVILSVNRLSGLTLAYLPPHDFLRVVDFFALLPITLLTLVLYYLLKRDIEDSGTVAKQIAVKAKNIENTDSTRNADATHRKALWINIIFILGLGVYAISSGDHETTNYLNNRFCIDDQDVDELCSIIAYHDNTFSHLLYYIGTILLTLAVLGTEALYPRIRQATRKNLVFLSVNGLLVASGIFANIARESAAIDLSAFAVLALLSSSLLWWNARKVSIKRLPVAVYMTIAYSVGLVSSIVYKLIAS